MIQIKNKITLFRTVFPFQKKGNKCYHLQSFIRFESAGIVTWYLLLENEGLIGLL